MALERLELLSEHGCFGGVQRFYKHFSVNQIGLPMRFALFLPPGDVLLSFLKTIIFAFYVMLVHCYYGYRASGGPAGVGVAVGRAVRLSLAGIGIIDFFLTLVMFGTTPSVTVA